MVAIVVLPAPSGPISATVNIVDPPPSLAGVRRGTGPSIVHSVDFFGSLTPEDRGRAVAPATPAPRPERGQRRKRRREIGVQQLVHLLRAAERVTPTQTEQPDPEPVRHRFEECLRRRAAQEHLTAVADREQVAAAADLKL